MTLNDVQTKGKSRVMYGLMLWALVLFGYFLFVFNWTIMNKLAGEFGKGGGWINTFFETKPDTIVTDAVNYTITFMRGVGSLLAGWVLVRFGHKKAVLIAMFMLSLALPFVGAGYWETQGGYAIFIIGRMLMAVGGTVLIVYTQPIISRFFSNKNKTLLSRINPLGFNIGTAIPLILFAINPIHDSMLQYWRIWAFVIAAIPAVLLVIYWFVAKDIEIVGKAAGHDVAEKDLKPSTWTHAIKDRNSWTLSLLYGFWLITVVSVILITPKHFTDLHNTRFNQLAPWETALPIILFLIGLIPGIYLVGWVLRTNIDRRTYISLVMFIGIASIVAAYLCTAYMESIALTCIFMFIAGIATWGIQGVMLNIPHEEKTNNPQRVGIVISLAWGIGYIIYTIANIILAVIFDAIFKSSLNIELAAWVQFGLLVFLMLGAVPTALFIVKTRDAKLKDTFKELKKLNQKG